MILSEVKAAACAKYALEWNRYDDAAGSVKAAIEEALAHAGITAEVKTRAKSKASFYRKVAKLDADEAPWAAIGDKLGARIVLESMRDLPRVLEALEEAGVLVIEVDDQRPKLDPRTLRYAGVHIEAKIPGVLDAEGEEIVFELQVRSRTLNAWSDSEHRLVYKSPMSLPPSTVRRLERLVVLVELFDEELTRGIEEVEAMPGFAESELLRALERHFERLSSSPGDDITSFEIMSLVLANHNDDDLPALRAEVDDLMAEDFERVARLFADHGPDAAEFDPTDWWLLSQPESLLILAMLRRSPLLVKASVAGTDIEPEVERLDLTW